MKKLLQGMVSRTCGRDTGGGNDIIAATRGGDDLIEAGAGRDSVTGGAGKDVILGGADGDFAPSEYPGQACIHDERMRWRTCAAIINSGKAVNDEATHAWRVAA